MDPLIKSQLLYQLSYAPGLPRRKAAERAWLSKAARVSPAKTGLRSSPHRRKNSDSAIIALDPRFRGSERREMRARCKSYRKQKGKAAGASPAASFGRRRASGRPRWPASASLATAPSGRRRYPSCRRDGRDDAASRGGRASARRRGVPASRSGASGRHRGSCRVDLPHRRAS